MQAEEPDPWIKHHDKPIRNLVISGGSIGGLIVAGVWRVIEEARLNKDIVNLAGCSVGSIFALLICLGYNARELAVICKYFRYKDHSSLSILGIFEQLGLEDGKNIMTLLKRLTELKAGNVEGELTFRSLFVITGRRLTVNAYCVEDDCGTVYSLQDSPDMPVLLAVRMSIAIPLVLTPVKYGGKTYVDGGLHDVFPLRMFNSAETLGIQIINRDTVFDMDEESGLIIALLKNLYKRLWTDRAELKEYRVIQVYSGVSSLSLDLSRQERKMLINKGYEAAVKKVGLGTPC